MSLRFLAGLLTYPKLMRLPDVAVSGSVQQLFFNRAEKPDDGNTAAGTVEDSDLIPF